MGQLCELDDVERAAIEERFDLGNYAADDADIGAAWLAEERDGNGSCENCGTALTFDGGHVCPNWSCALPKAKDRCMTHLLDEPCPTCAAYIAAGL